MIPRSSVALALADTMLARDASVGGLIESVVWSFERTWPWVPALCEAIHARTGEHFYSYSRYELADIILENDDFHNAFLPDGFEFDYETDEDEDALVEVERGPAPQIRRYCVTLPISPEKPDWLAALPLPALPSVGDLARWLKATPTELGWFADQWRLDSAPVSRLQHYHYRLVPKRSGGTRLIEVPKQRLRAMQSKILRGLLDLVPAHDAAHGFRRSRSCVSHAALHAGKRVVIRMDLKNFFPSIPASRIDALFRKLGYSTSVAGMLARICVNRTPAGVFRDSDFSWTERKQLRTPHLPQGSPCSPALANLCAYRLDMRLEALAAALGARYSRYADDLVFSGERDLERALDRFHVQVAAIALEEGFDINTRKTRMMRAGTRQQVTGIVINRHPNIRRDEFDRLKATLTNCARHGPASQNREKRDNYRAYLAGKIAFVTMVNASRGTRLQRLFDTIVWP